MSRCSRECTPRPRPGRLTSKRSPPWWPAIVESSPCTATGCWVQWKTPRTRCRKRFSPHVEVSPASRSEAPSGLAVQDCDKCQPPDGRRRRMLSWDTGPARSPLGDLGVPLIDSPWLEPWLGADDDPADFFSQREAIDLAYVAALQHLLRTDEPYSSFVMSCGSAPRRGRRPTRHLSGVGDKRPAASPRHRGRARPGAQPATRAGRC